MLNYDECFPYFLGSKSTSITKILQFLKLDLGISKQKVWKSVQRVDVLFLGQTNKYMTFFKQSVMFF